MKRILIILLFSFSFFEINAFAKPTYVRALEVHWSRNATGLTFNKDGSKIYIVSSRRGTNNGGFHSSTTDSVVEYSLGTNFSLSGVETNDGSADVEMGIRGKCGDNAASLVNPEDLHWNNDGTRLFIVDNTTGVPLSLVKLSKCSQSSRCNIAVSPPCTFSSSIFNINNQSVFSLT